MKFTCGDVLSLVMKKLNDTKIQKYDTKIFFYKTNSIFIFIFS